MKMENVSLSRTMPLLKQLKCCISIVMNFLFAIGWLNVVPTNRKSFVFAIGWLNVVLTNQNEFLDCHWLVKYIVLTNKNEFLDYHWLFKYSVDQLE